ncbi:ABC transporter permease|uniref:Peptide/nickel transport system permease protein n=1 Tax=Dendrosporobacter quercicolus TaxID=146817 RepID=A0A1G9QXD1_9FIRM|nr:ABC transporter permease [Dendrosporobacter quercicolus]NSL48376.1 ABC transporter permease [Dendrosporobacter quercicolus DSM 1736]SDM14885.1 peptide/nickel transport system permease protein [Dendrosporobacter quercicolus]
MNSNSKWLPKIWISFRNKQWLLKKLGEGLLLFWIISLVSFAIVQVAPGDATLSLLRIDTIAITVEQVEALRQEMGMNDPLYQKYVRYMANLFQGDLGESVMTGRTVAAELIQAFPATFLLAATSLLLTVLLVAVFGSLSALYTGSWIDKFSTAFCLMGASIPTFWLGLLLIDLFSVRLGLLPAVGMANGGLVLPSLALAIAIAPPFIKIFRNSLIDCARQDYIRAARSRGISERLIFSRHILKGSLIPVVTILGVSLGSLLGGSVVVEVIFGLPGVGKLAIEAVTRRDYAIIQGFVLSIGLLIFFINLMVDLSYRYLNPAISLKEAERR